MCVYALQWWSKKREPEWVISICGGTRKLSIVVAVDGKRWRWYEKREATKNASLCMKRHRKSECERHLRAYLCVLDALAMGCGFSVENDTARTVVVNVKAIFGEASKSTTTTFCPKCDMAFYCHADNITENKSLKSGNGTSCALLLHTSHFSNINIQFRSCCWWWHGKCLVMKNGES